MSGSEREYGVTPEDELEKVLSQAEAMVLLTYGASGENFRDCTDRLQDDFMWALHDKITEAQRIARELSRMPREIHLVGVSPESRKQESSADGAQASA